MVGFLCFFVFLWEIQGDPSWPMADGQAYLAHNGIFGDHDLQSGQGPAEQDPLGREKGGGLEGGPRGGLGSFPTWREDWYI